MSWRISRQSDADIDEYVIDYGVSRFNRERIERYLNSLFHQFDNLASMPGIGRDRSDENLSVRTWVYDPIVIVYTIESRGIFIRRILPASSDWRSHDLSGDRV